MAQPRPKSLEWRERAAYYRSLAENAGSDVGGKALLEVADGWEDLANRVAQLEDRDRIQDREGGTYGLGGSGRARAILAKSD
jgi:hypothetical protein